MCIYKIQNLITNEIYVGSALNFQKRKWSHLHKLRHNKHHSPILQNSWNKNGEINFNFIVIEEVDIKENLIIREQYYIDTLLPKYNCSKIAGSPLGVKHTLQSRLNMSKSHLGKTLTPESIKKRTKTVLGSKRSKETIDTMINSAKKLPIIQYDLKNAIIKEWSSASEVSRILKINRGHITSCCTGNRKTCGGFIWKYK